MKALTLRQPWAALVALDYKRVETRSWQTPHRGPLAIHASAGWNRDERAFAAEITRGGVDLSPALAFGAVLAVVRLAGILRTEVARDQVSSLERELGDYSAGRFAWQLEDLALLPEPIAATGALGLWEAEL